jgi:preprotein translocase subunit YajC
METIALFVLIILVLSIFILIKLIKNERDRKKFNDIMKPGDEVKVPTIDYVIGEILEINDDEVKVVIKVNKSIVYPNKK